MNHIRLFVALVAACIFVMPALSMPSNEIGQEQKQCVCPNSPKDCQKMCQGQDSKENTCGCQKSMMGNKVGVTQLNFIMLEYKKKVSINST